MFFAAGRREDLGNHLLKKSKILVETQYLLMTDVKIKSDIIHLHDTAINNFGKLNFAFNNAGIFLKKQNSMNMMITFGMNILQLD